MENADIHKNIYESWREITPEQVEQWLSQENISKRETRTFAGFEIVDSLDGRQNPLVEVSLVRLLKEGQYPQHIHDKSDAYFIISKGKAIFLSGQDKSEMVEGDRKEIPRGTPHGFEISDGQTFEFISLQSPPIKDEHTGDEDFRLVDRI